MGVDSTTFVWIKDLQEKFNVFGSASNILEFGPQLITNRFSWDQSEVEARFLYKDLGITDYNSVDNLDGSATINGDLNFPVTFAKKFDIITDFGTMEHVFDVKSFLQNCHEATSENGVMLHVVPTAHGYNHGFFNFNSVLFLNLAKYNNYEILDIRYVPSHAAQAIICNKNLSRKSSKPFKLYSITDMKVLNNIEIMFFELLKMRLKIICKLRLLPRRQYLKKLILSGDSLFVALRKNSSGPLMLPTQEKYSVE